MDAIKTLPQMPLAPTPAAPTDAEAHAQRGLRIELGRRWIGAEQAGVIGPGSVIDLNAAAEDAVEVYAGGRLIAKGTPVTADGKFAVRIGEMARTG